MNKLLPNKIFFEFTLCYSILLSSVSSVLKKITKFKHRVHRGNRVTQRFLCLYHSLIIFIIVLFPQLIFSQNYFSGKVVDSQTKEPLAFVNILANNLRQVHQTDIDGAFKITSVPKIDSLTLSYVGYETFVYKIKANTKNILIELKRKQIQLSEVVVIPGENPAHRIIRKVIENRDKNNPEKIGSFSYTSYNKVIFTANLDSLKKDTVKSDTNRVKVRNFFEKQYLFLMESVTERKFMYPDKNNEKLIASKISGFNDPLFAMLITQMQSFSFYNELIHIGDYNYVTPISKGSIEKYFYLIEDTLYQGHDTIFVISYKPHRNRTFDGLKGLLYINTNGYAIQSVIAEPAIVAKKGMAIKIQQKYELIDNKQWFPVQLNSDFIFKNVSVNNVNLIGEGRSYLQDIVLNPEFKKSEFSNVEMELNSTSNNPNDLIWSLHRIDSLTDKDKRTYHIVDSLGKAAHLDRTVKSLETLISGKIPIKNVDLDIDKILNYNDYEGFRVGLGLHNNYKLSKKIIVGGYFAYGFNDKASKYGADASFNFHDNHDISFGIKYFNDVFESGGISFYEQQGFLSDANYRHYLISRMDKTENRKAFLHFTSFKYLKAEVSLSQINKAVTNNYGYGVKDENVTVLFNNFNFTELGVGLCYSYKEKFIKTSDNKISMGTKYPILYFNYIKGFNNLLNGDYKYNKYEFKIKKSFFIKSLGTPTIQFQAGYIDGDLPYCNLFNGIGSYRQFTIAAPNSFETMRMNEFLSNRYAALFFTHNFGKLLIRTKKSAPDIAIATNACIGDLNNAAKHFNVNIQTLRKGFLESGLLINNILNTGFYGLGVGAFYRYGYYALPAFKDNIAYKFTLTIFM